MFGILGAGRIGTAVAKRADAFGSKIIYYSNVKNPIIEKKFKARRAGLSSLLKTADIISVHLPLTSETFRLIDAEKLKLMKKTAVLINTARGEIVDEKALIKVLKKGSIGGAGLDVFENEPEVNKELLKLNNVIVLPHIGSATKEARTGMAMLAAKNAANVLSGRKPVTPVYE